MRIVGGNGERWPLVTCHTSAIPLPPPLKRIFSCSASFTRRLGDWKPGEVKEGEGGSRQLDLWWLLTFFAGNFLSTKIKPCLFVYWLLRGNCQSQFFSWTAGFEGLVQHSVSWCPACNVVNKSPGLKHLFHFERPLAEGWNLTEPWAGLTVTLFLGYFETIFIARGPASPANHFRRELNTCQFLNMLSSLRISFPNSKKEF